MESPWGCPPRPLPATSATCSHQSSPAFRAGVGSTRGKGRQGEQSLKAKVSLCREATCHPDQYSGLSRTYGSSCEQDPSKQILPASGCVDLVFEEDVGEGRRFGGIQLGLQCLGLLGGLEQIPWQGCGAQVSCGLGWHSWASGLAQAFANSVFL